MPPRLHPAVGSREDAPPAHGGGFGNGFSREVVLRELDRILQSPSFRTSRQCQRFFRYVVEQTLDQNDDFLHERSIGREVFGRKADYDTSTDPIVRVRAGEIRKRLAQYYMESGADCDMRFELPPGSYRAQLSGNEAAGAAPKQPTVRPSRRIWPWLVGAVAVAVVASASLLLTGVYRESALDAFWRPVLSSNRPILICSGHPVVYFLSSRIHARYREQLSAKALPLQGPYVIPLRPDELVEGRDIVPVTDQYIGAGDSVVATRLSALFGRHGKDWQLRFGNDVSFTDLRSAPAVLIGAFSNRWTLTMTEKLRFVFDFDSGVKRIIDHADARIEWALPDIAPDGRTTHDYAIVSRIFHSETGEMLISAAGITQYGTQATAEFLMNDDLIKQAVRDAPPDWKNRNMQVVLRTKVVGRTTGPPEILAVHFW